MNVMKQITIRISEQQERDLKKIAEKNQQSITGYIRSLIDYVLQNKSQDISKLKSVISGDCSNFQSKTIRLLYRILFLSQIELGKTYPNDYKEIMDLSEAEAKIATEKLAND